MTPEQPEEKKFEFKFRYVLLMLALLLFLLAIFSHDPADLAVLEHGSREPIRNLIGPVGAQISRALFYLFGIAVYPLVFFFMICIGRTFIPVPTRRKGYSGALLAVVFGTTLLFAMWPQEFTQWTESLGIGHAGNPAMALSGGVIGAQFAAPETEYLPAGLIRRHIGTVGTLVVALAFLLFGIIFVFFADWKSILLSKFDLNFSIRRKNSGNAAAEDDPDDIPLRTPVQTPGRIAPYRPQPEVEQTPQPQPPVEKQPPADPGYPPLKPKPFTPPPMDDDDSPVELKPQRPTAILRSR